jgi:hypothetical protein
MLLVALFDFDEGINLLAFIYVGVEPKQMAVWRCSLPTEQDAG